MSTARKIPTHIIEQLQQTARETGKKTYLYYDNNREWQASDTYWKDWLAYAYPGGRTVIAGDNAEIEIWMPLPNKAPPSRR